MSSVSRLRSFARNLFHRGRFEKELDDELAAYVEQLAEEKIAAGMAASDARRAARLELGGAEQVKEEVRAVRAGALVDATWQDLRYAVRMLRRNPGFAAAVVVTLGLGIGVNTAIFSVVNAFLLKPLPAVRAPGELVWLRGSSSFAELTAYREQSRPLFTEMAAIGGSDRLNLGAGGRAELINGELCTAGMFTVLGVEPALGRGFVPGDDEPGGQPVVVVSHALWLTRFAGDPDLIGKTLRINGLAAVVVGVAPRGFIGAELGRPRDVWLPMALQPRIGPGSAEDGTIRDLRHDPGVAWLNVIARRRPDVTLAQAQAAMATIAARVAADQTADDRDDRVRAAGLLPVVGGLDPRDRLDAVVVAAFLMIVVGLVLLIACSNVAGLLLARAASRAKELGIRRALGAGRLRVIRQLLTESLILALLGGAAGLALASWASSLLGTLGRTAAIAPPDLAVDGRVLGFAAALSLLTTVLFGLAPAIHASRGDVMAALKLDSGALRSRARRPRLRSGLVVAQVALSLLLLITAGLFVRSLRNARRVDPGFTVERALLLELHPATLGLTVERGRQLYEQILDGVIAVPGVERATLMGREPLGFSSGKGEVAAEAAAGEPPPRAVLVGFDVAGPGYAAAMGIPLRRGRDFSAADRAGAPAVALVSESLARRLFAAADPIGRRIRFGGDTALEIVGVAGDSKVMGLGDDGREMLLLPILQSYRGSATLVVRTAMAPAAVVGAVQARLTALAPDLPQSAAKTLADQVDQALLPARLGATLLGAFGLLALALSAVGVYGLVAYSVRQRTHEIGVRVALGASRGDVLGLILREALVVVGVGAAVGVALALAATRLVGSFLYGLTASDPTTFAGVSVVLLLVALLASYLPARRALGVDPLVALRAE